MDGGGRWVVGLTRGMGHVGCVGGCGMHRMHEWVCMTKGGGGHGNVKGTGWVWDMLVWMEVGGD